MLQRKKTRWRLRARGLLHFWSGTNEVSSSPGANPSEAPDACQATYTEPPRQPKSATRTRSPQSNSPFSSSRSPLGISDPEKPNIASTLWRTVASTKARRYYFEAAFSPTIFWVDMAKLKPNRDRIRPN